MARYGQFCPVSKTAEVLCERWAILVVREVLAGSTRFGDIARGLPGCPPATLAKRLRELVRAGVINRTETDDGVAYRMTDAGWELYPIVEGFGRWGQRWARSTYDDDELDVDLLLWDLHRFLDPRALGRDRVVVELQVRVPEGRTRYFWISVERGEVDLCLVDPGHPVDVVVWANLRSLTRVWMGDIRFDEGVAAGDLAVRGPVTLAGRIPAWLGRHPVLGSIGPAEAQVSGRPHQPIES